MAILVTGGAGYIGTHVCLELLESSYDVVVMDNFVNSHPEALKRVEELAGKRVTLYAVDLLNREEMVRIFEREEIEAVIHLGGLKAVGESVEKPLEYYHVNVTGTLHLCSVMKQFGVKKFVFSSSATVYGMPEQVPITEDAELKALNPYGWTKLMIEQILTDLSSSDRDWSVALLRYFNPIGAHPSGRLGEDPRGTPNNLMPYLTQVAVGKREYLQVYGDDYPTVDGTGVRDYIHIVDLAKGHLAALRYVMKVNGVEAFNLGTGRGCSVLEVITTFEEASGIKIPYQVVERRKGDAAVCYASPEKAKQTLGWKAKKSLKEMCEDAWRWQRENPNGYQ
ncbi:UDP-glucose 4-epimerase GalE [Paenibacillus sp.]|uniref:UDP-glucose 4-epimerase GalE n=1 Tax=Paenibacillus sp. TaxID=58172 RepID=UPI002D53A3D5|nr:UDP-glucose 4-epimerase GalE [Paenibacillus sp.]HZG86166.1 UDP-glucose 4-epimerase GalE [Paenibacillus sp.]